MEFYEEYRKTSNLGSQAASFEVFRKNFHEKKLFIKTPKIDTCATCDRLTLEMRVVEDDEKPIFQAKPADHQLLAGQAYAEKQKDKEISKKDPSKKTITFDLQ